MGVGSRWELRELGEPWVVHTKGALGSKCREASGHVTLNVMWRNVSWPEGDVSSSACLQEFTR